MTINLDNIDNKNLFMYITLAIIILFIFSKIDIKLNFLYGTILCFVVVWYVNEHKQQEIQKHDQVISDKIALLRPKPKNTAKYEEMTDYLFSIQDLYIYNPLSYEEMITNIDIFFDCYEETVLDNSVAGERYYDARLYKRNALNALHSLINNIPPNDKIIKKLNDALEKLEILLNTYMDKIERFHKLYVYEHGYNINTKLIDKGWFPKNLYESSIFEPLGVNMHYYDFY